MPATAQDNSVSKTAVWAGRIISVLVVLFLLFDSAIKVLKLAAAVDGTVQVGYPAGIVRPLGIVLLTCVVLYVIPRTSILGAILLTGYLGGATATMVRLSNPLFWMPVAVGVLAWLGIFLRDERLRTLIPLRSSTPQ
jgi:DoxX-like family